MEPLFRFMKHAEKVKNRIIIPKFLIEKYGRDFYLEIYEDETIKLVPVNAKKKGK